MKVISDIIRKHPSETRRLIKTEFDRLKENEDWEKIDEILTCEELTEDFYRMAVLLDETFDIRKKLKNRKKLGDKFDA
jgi:hypothetical protein